MRNGTLSSKSILLSVCTLLAQVAIAAPSLIATETQTAHAAPIEPRQPSVGDWQTLSHERLGFQIDYPANVFRPAAQQPSEAGQVLVSHDGLAKLLIAAFDNDAEASLNDYRAHVLETSYPDADIDYAPVRRNWFVLSGTRNGTEFYERVSFTCAGRRITSWAILYPYTQRNYYNPILETIARTFRPSRTADSGC